MSEITAGGSKRDTALIIAHNEVAQYLVEGGSEDDTVAEFRDWIREERRTLHTESE